MTAEAKALLDELMGRSRNLDPNEQPDELSWDNPDVCKHFLCGFCPHELFTNTRADLGPCTKIHDDAFRKEYQNSPRFEKCGFEEDFIRFLQTLVTDVEKRIRRGHQRLALNSQQGTLNGSIGNPNEEKIKLLTERINELVVQAEELGCEGKVEEAQGVMKLADQLTEERHQAETKPNQEDGPMMKQMEVCEVCGAFLIVGDAPQRQDEHLMGKQHAGYAQVRAEIEKRKQKAKDEIEAREASELKLKQEREERERERQREREERRQRERDREREKEREKERARRRRSRSRSRDRDRRRRRSTSRERRRTRRSRSRSRERKRRSRSGSRSQKSSRRSSSRDRKSSRKRSRERRSKSRNRSRSKERKDRTRDDKDRKSNGNEREKKEDRKSGSCSRDSEPPELTREVYDSSEQQAGSNTNEFQGKISESDECREDAASAAFGSGMNSPLNSEGDSKIDD